ncbi:MAG: C40 family peptidase [Burkholderiales bacterium]|nr:C40 family peptidase [Burkholderiales bacterium]
MKIKKITFLTLLCASCIFKYGVFVNADQISDIVAAHSNQNLATTESQAIPSGIVTTDTVDNTKNNDAIGEILIQAMSLMGISYKWGGNTPETGMDCSGFIRYVFKKSMGINLPRTANEMSKVGIRVTTDEMQPGDLIFFNTLHGRRNSHMGMYIGNNQFIQSPRTGQRIQISEYNNYWRSHTNGVKRIVQEKDTDSTQSNDNIQTFEYVKNQALPTGYIGTKKGKHIHHHVLGKKSAKKTKHISTKNTLHKFSAKKRKSR